VSALEDIGRVARVASSSFRRAAEGYDALHQDSEEPLLARAESQAWREARIMTILTAEAAYRQTRPIERLKLDLRWRV